MKDIENSRRVNVSVVEAMSDGSSQPSMLTGFQVGSKDVEALILSQEFWPEQQVFAFTFADTLRQLRQVS